MKKGIVMRLEVYIEGEDGPAHDFSQTGRDVLLKVLRSAIQQVDGAYAVRVRKVEPVEGGDGDDEDTEDFDPNLDLLATTPPPQPPPPTKP